MKPLRVGIAGAGLMGRWHASAGRRAGAQIAAVADIDLAAADRLAAKHAGARSYPDIRRMIDECSLDALHICTPLDTHFQVAEQAIEAGLHLLIEKPMTPFAHQTVQLYEQAAARNLTLCPVHQFLLQDGVLKVAESLPRIGRVIHIEGTFCSAGAAGQSAEMKAAIAADILPHPLSLMQRFVAGNLADARWDVCWPGTGEIRVAAECKEVSLSIFVSMAARPTVCTLQIYGTSGSIHLDLFHGFAVVEPGDVSKLRKVVRPFDLASRLLSGAAINLGRRVIRWQPAYPGLQRLIEHFYHAVQSGIEPPISPAETISVAQVRDQLVEPRGFVIPTHCFNKW